jgi:hypothetical protein
MLSSRHSPRNVTAIARAGGRQRRGCYRSTRNKKQTTASERDPFAVGSLQDIPLDTATFKTINHCSTPIAEAHLFAAARERAMELKFISGLIAIARQHAATSRRSVH